MEWDCNKCNRIKDVLSCEKDNPSPECPKWRFPYGDKMEWASRVEGEYWRKMEEAVE